MCELEELMEALDRSIKKNGDKPLTLSHLRNIIKRIVQREGGDCDVAYEDTF